MFSSQQIKAYFIRFLTRKKTTIFEIKNTRNILFLRYDRIGDMVITTPVFRELKLSYPEINISVLASKLNRGVLVNNPYIDKLILQIRKKSIISNKSFYTPKGKRSAKDIIDGINNGLSVVLLVDQKDSAGELVPFFNVPCKTQTGFLKLARKYKMKIIPVLNLRNKDNHFTLKFYPPIEEISDELSDIDTMQNIHYE